MFASQDCDLMRPGCHQPGRTQTDVAALGLATLSDKFQRNDVIDSSYVDDHPHDLRTIHIAPKWPSRPFGAASQRIEEAVQGVHDRFPKTIFVGAQFHLHAGLDGHVEISGAYDLYTRPDNSPGTKVSSHSVQQSRSRSRTSRW